MRFSISTIHSYSSDELSAINRLNFDSFHDLLELGVKKGDFHPAGVQLFEKFWSSLFGTSEMALRLPFVILGVLAILLVYAIGKKYSSKNAGIIAATLLTVTYFPVIHSELARPYSPGLLFVLLSCWFYLKFFFDEFPTNKKKYTNAIALGICLALTMYSHYFAFMLVGFMGVTGLFFLKKNNFFPYFLAAIIAFILFSPHFLITAYHFGIEGGLGWLGRPDKLWLFDFLFYAFNESLTFTSIVVITIIIAIVGAKVGDKKNKRKLNLLLFIWFFGIYIVALIFSYTSSPILKFPVMLFPLPFFFLLIGSFFSNTNQKQFNIIFGLLLFFGIGSTLFEKDLFGNKHFGLLKEIAEPMVKWRAKYGAENIVSYLNINNPNYLNYYAIPLGDSLTFDKDVLEFDEDVNIRKELLNEKRPYCIVGYSTRTTLPQTFETCKEFYPNIIEYHKYNNSSIVLLSKNKEDSSVKLNTKLISEFRPAKKPKDWEYSPQQIQNHYYFSDSTARFGPTYNFKLANIPGLIYSRHKNYFKITVKADADVLSQITATLSAKRNDKPVLNNRGKAIWKGKKLEDMLLSPNDNNLAYFAFDIPREIKPKDVIQMSLWNRNGKPVKIFNIKIELIEDIF